MLTAGTRLGPYQILSMLGRGGMGEVYRALDTRLDRTVAVKVIRERESPSSSLLQRFEREAKTLAALTHSSILTLFDFGREGEIMFAVSELLEGETLRVRLSDTTLSWKRALEIAASIAEGLAAAHAASIIHRDLKPENVFLVLDGRVKVLDFGLARWSGDVVDTRDSAATDVLVTDEGMTLGTAGYMSPEQIRGERAGPHSDIFSLGCMLYEMIGGKRPFLGVTYGDVCAATLRDEPPDLEELRSGLPREVGALVRRCLQKKKDERFQSASDLAFALRALTAEKSVDQSSSGSRPAHSIESIAVLPFTNVGGDPDLQYLSEGVAESILNTLSGLSENLKVMSRSAVFRYRGSDVDSLAAGREMGVRVVLTGRVHQRGKQLAISVELVDTNDGARLWGESYKREADDLLTIEEEIAREISAKLRLRLSGDEKEKLALRPTHSTEAYRSYLRGRYFCEKRTAEGMRRGIEEFSAAIEEDPRYAKAYAGLADSYVQLGYYCELRPREAFTRAKAAALNALRIDPSLAEARGSLASVLFYFDWNWPAAAREFEASLAANPDDANAHHIYAIFLTAMGKKEQGLMHARSAEEIDPLNLSHKTATAALLYWSGRHDEALEKTARIVEMDLAFPPAHHVRGFILTAMGRHAEAIEELRHASALTDGGTWFRLSMAHACAAGGMIEESDRVLAELMKSDRYLSPFVIACIRTAQHRYDEAFLSLDRAFEDRDCGLVMIGFEPRLNDLRRDPRFAAVSKKLGAVAVREI
jgi:serine/threonine protein kinase/tetratricopeptide (TPR) repeat protein